MDSNAVRSDHFGDFRALIHKADEATPEIADETRLGTLGQSEGWLLLKDYINDLKDSLDQAYKTAMESGMSYEEIGRRTIIAQLTKEYLDKVVEKVEDAKTALESGQK